MQECSLRFLPGALSKLCALHLMSFDRIQILLFSLWLPPGKMCVCVYQKPHFPKLLGVLTWDSGCPVLFSLQSEAELGF